MRRKRESFKSIAQELMYKFERLETRLNEATLQLRKVEMRLEFIRGEYMTTRLERSENRPDVQVRGLSQETTL